MRLSLRLSFKESPSPFTGEVAASDCSRRSMAAAAMCWPAERETGLLLIRAGPAVAAGAEAVCLLGEATSAGTTGTAVKLAAAAAVGGSGGGTAAGEGPGLLA